MVKKALKENPTFSFTKMSGTGNDFLIADLHSPEKMKLFKEFTMGLSRAEVAKKLCDRHFGLGADGLVLLEKSEQADFGWDFYNADGSTAEMCGNAARCVGLWVHKNWQWERAFKFATQAGIITAQAHSPEQVEVTTTPIQSAEFEQKIRIFDQDIDYAFINSGVPHLVIRLDNGLSQVHKYKELASSLRHHPHFQPQGTNVTFYSPHSEKSIRAISFERGVENFTLSCGTGAVAAAYAQFKLTKNGEILVKVPGGDLTIAFMGKAPRLIGPATFVAECTVYGDKI